MQTTFKRCGERDELEKRIRTCLGNFSALSRDASRYACRERTYDSAEPRKFFQNCKRNMPCYPGSSPSCMNASNCTRPTTNAVGEHPRTWPQRLTPFQSKRRMTTSSLRNSRSRAQMVYGPSRNREQKPPSRRALPWPASTGNLLISIRCPGPPQLPSVRGTCCRAAIAIYSPDPKISAPPARTKNPGLSCHTRYETSVPVINCV